MFFRTGETVETTDTQIIKRYTYSGFDHTQHDARRWLESLDYISIDVKELFLDMHRNGNSYVFGPLELSIEHVDKATIANHWTITATYTGVALGTLEIGTQFLPMFSHMALELKGWTEIGARLSDGEYFLNYQSSYQKDSLVIPLDNNDYDGE